ncbi:MAG: helix-turn-helix domain-containing protein [Proteobacteria bacterium]|nr:helix-turn-helix domain-containing protein [Pseudomonadota bacterium]
MAYSGDQRKLLREFGTRVRAARKALGWTQEDLAAEVGVDRTYIGGVERGERNPGLYNVNRIALALNESFAGLLPFCAGRRRR